ncbi:MAG TPA: ABC transporter permease [Ilumatobacteraceae bacterium]|nr:ABC transporter permease [Ilumatobacteraceae bacterium]
MKTLGARLLAPVLGVIAFFAAWQAAIEVWNIPKYALSSPLDILRSLRTSPRFYFDQARPTLWAALLAFVLSLLIGTVAASIMASSRFVERAASPLIVLVQVTPILAYAPAVVIWLGYDLAPILFLTVLISTVPFIANGVTGLRSVAPLLLELAHSVDARRWEVFVRLRLMSALPSLFSAARIAVGTVLIGVVIGEWFAGVSSGLGYTIKVASNRNLPLVMWASVFVLGTLGALTIVLIGLLERIVLHWHASQRRA